MCSSYYRPSPTPTEAELVQKLFEEEILDIKQITQIFQGEHDARQTDH